MATGDTLTVANEAVLTNAAAGTIDLAGAGSDLYGYGNGTGPGVVDNNGTLDAQLTTGTSSISTPLDHQSVPRQAGGRHRQGVAHRRRHPERHADRAQRHDLEIDSGTLGLDGTTFSGAGLTQLTSTATLTGTNTVNCALQLLGLHHRGGTLAMTGQSTLSGGTFSATGTTTSSGALTVASGGNIYGPFTNSGTLTVATGDTLTVANEAVLTNAAAGTIDLAGAGSDLYGYGNGTGPGVVDNNRHLDAQLTTGTSSISTPLTTSLSHVKLAAGTGKVSLTDGGTLSGTLTVPSGTTFEMDDGGTLGLDGTTFSGAGLTQLTSTATLTGTNTVNSLFSFSGSTTGGGHLGHDRPVDVWAAPSAPPHQRRAALDVHLRQHYRRPPSGTSPWPPATP